jgi:hypothetical protein
MKKGRKTKKSDQSGGSITMRSAGEVVVTHLPTAPKGAPGKRIHERRPLPPAKTPAPSDREKTVDSGPAKK